MDKKQYHNNYYHQVRKKKRKIIKDKIKYIRVIFDRINTVLEI